MSFAVSVIIVSYNVTDFLKNCLLSVKKSIGLFELEIIVVDNGSQDSTIVMIKEYFPDIKLIENKKDLGFSKAVNIGLKYATGDFLLVLNPDTIIAEDTISILYDYLQANKDVAMCGPKILNKDGSLQLACRRSFPYLKVILPKVLGLNKLFPKSSAFGKFNYTNINPNKTHVVDAISGSCMFFRRQILEKVKGLDERFFMFCEDDDFCLRIKIAGYNIYYVSTTMILHYKGASYEKNQLRSRTWLYNSINLFADKHFLIKQSKVLFYMIKCGVLLMQTISYVSWFFRHFSFLFQKNMQSLLRFLLPNYQKKILLILGSTEKSIYMLEREQKLSKNYQSIWLILNHHNANKIPNTKNSFFNVTTLNEIDNILAQHTDCTLWFVDNNLSYKNILTTIERHKGHKHLTYKIIPSAHYNKKMPCPGYGQRIGNRRELFYDPTLL